MHITPSNKLYIGITGQDINERWRKGNGYNHQVFYRAIKKYKWENIEHVIIADDLTEKEAKRLEIDLIKYWDTTNKKNGYNSSLGGENITLGYKYSYESRKKMGKPIYQFNMNGDFIKEWISASEIENILHIGHSQVAAVCNYKHGYTHGFVWRYKNDSIFKKYKLGTTELKEIIKFKTHKRVSKKGKNLNNCSKTVYQFDTNGNFIKEYPSCSEVARCNNISGGAISNAAKNNLKSMGFLWSYENKCPKIKEKNYRYKAIYQYSLNGKLLKKWKGAICIKKELGFDNSTIIKACKGKVKTSYGYRWSYNELNNKEICFES